MLDSYKSEQQHFISIATNQEKINRAIQSEAVAQADKDEYMSRVKVKEDETEPQSAEPVQKDFRQP